MLGGMRYFGVGPVLSIHGRRSVLEIRRLRLEAAPVA
jgi:hypothetical protein